MCLRTVIRVLLTHVFKGLTRVLQLKHVFKGQTRVLLSQVTRVLQLKHVFMGVLLKHVFNGPNALNNVFMGLTRVLEGVLKCVLDGVKRNLVLAKYVCHMESKVNSLPWVSQSRQNLSKLSSARRSSVLPKHAIVSSEVSATHLETQEQTKQSRTLRSASNRTSRHRMQFH